MAIERRKGEKLSEAIARIGGTYPYREAFDHLDARLARLEQNHQSPIGCGPPVDLRPAQPEPSQPNDSPPFTPTELKDFAARDFVRSNRKAGQPEPSRSQCTCVCSKLVTPPGYHEPQCPMHVLPTGDAAIKAWDDWWASAKGEPAPDEVETAEAFVEWCEFGSPSDHEDALQRLRRRDAAMRAEQRRKWSEDERVYAIELREQHLRAEKAEAERDEWHRTCEAYEQGKKSLQAELATERAALKVREQYLCKAEQQRDAAVLERDAIKRDYDAELEGRKHIRTLNGARDDESFFQFVGRLQDERIAAESRIAAAMALITEYQRCEDSIRQSFGKPPMPNSQLEQLRAALEPKGEG